MDRPQQRFDVTWPSAVHPVAAGTTGHPPTVSLV